MRRVVAPLVLMLVSQELEAEDCRDSSQATEESAWSVGTGFRSGGETAQQLAAITTVTGKFDQDEGTVHGEL